MNIPHFHKPSQVDRLRIGLQQQVTNWRARAELSRKNNWSSVEADTLADCADDLKDTVKELGPIFEDISATLFLYRDALEKINELSNQSEIGSPDVMDEIYSLSERIIDMK